ncbi:hypothetical protein TPHA_0H02730 [Tetrapisispora phaffii CBS 4417]|uniref:Uncharacterized protein n=1 Tax=Tetrapisispora phaffii (strain ATCC 24235 / CBS 4417 / NBRC 1672 / NRRL Y-8282 / UCD 70-5) TaxID=1071381 RepID=G8BWM5_TETPH|nr:hypothetical protein TPHA_0H02730 [Tetrapisispora phaffii CBS 4417]CCE64476.1 hypothetical protein TPHA_0H02730 [Tetrapisispora phaffii CBS 4417]
MKRAHSSRSFFINQSTGTNDDDKFNIDADIVLPLFTVSGNETVTQTQDEDNVKVPTIKINNSTITDSSRTKSCRNLQHSSNTSINKRSNAKLHVRSYNRIPSIPSFKHLSLVQNEMLSAGSGSFSNTLFANEEDSSIQPDTYISDNESIMSATIPKDTTPFTEYDLYLFPKQINHNNNRQKTRSYSFISIDDRQRKLSPNVNHFDSRRLATQFLESSNTPFKEQVNFHTKLQIGNKKNSFSETKLSRDNLLEGRKSFKTDQIDNRLYIKNLNDMSEVLSKFGDLETSKPSSSALTFSSSSSTSSSSSSSSSLVIDFKNNHSALGSRDTQSKGTVFSEKSSTSRRDTDKEDDWNIKSMDPGIQITTNLNEVNFSQMHIAKRISTLEILINSGITNVIYKGENEFHKLITNFDDLSQRLQKLRSNLNDITLAVKNSHLENLDKKFDRNNESSLIYQVTENVAEFVEKLENIQKRYDTCKSLVDRHREVIRIMEQELEKRISKKKVKKAVDIQQFLMLV